MSLPPKNSFTFALAAEQQERLRAMAAEMRYKTCVVPHTTLAFEGPNCRVNLYTSGKCLVQGRGAEDFVLYFLEPVVLQSAGLGYEEVLNPENFEPHMGSDESGKGDFFGPLVTAAAYVDKDLILAMQELGVKDCKLMTDKQTLFIGAKLRELLGKERHTVVMMGPEAYNRLYGKFRNVNDLLAWAHARCIENLLETVPDCPRAVADQFAGEQAIKRALMKKGRKIKLEQRHKAESDMAVAAASVLAREAFLRGLYKLGDSVAAALPKGATDVANMGIELVKKHGPSVLARIAKCHFATTDRVLAAAGFSRGDLPADARAQSRSAQK
ncbi:MAG: ribonuclease HIII [Kiritimatiellaeota bacterium]|nr:ribonuclease HIII [Kiritimatiellota bacterium]